MGGNSPKSDYTDDALSSIRDRYPFKRSNTSYSSNNNAAARSKATPLPHKTSRSHHNQHRRKFSSFFSFRGRQWQFYLCFLIVIFGFALVTVVLQNSITSVFRQVDIMRWPWSGIKFGSSLEFFSHLSLNESRLDRLRSQPRVGIRPPGICLILGNLKKDPSTLMIYSVMKNLKGLGYALKVYALEEGSAISIWQDIGGPVTILRSERYGSIDWSIFEGVVVDSIEAKYAISSLMQEPFCSVPLIWIIQEDILASRLELYQDKGWHHLISNWKDAFSRASAVVFPAFSFPMLYSALDTGNFIVIPGSPADVWAAEVYNKTHSKSQLRQKHNFADDEVVILIIGSSFFYNELAWDYAVAMHAIEPLLREYCGSNNVGLTSKFVFLSGNSSNYSDALQDVATRLRLDQGSLRHFGISSDVNGLMLMADIVLYGSSQEEQAFPPLLSRALSFGIPVVAPNYPVITKHVFDGLNGIIYPKNNPSGLKSAFSRLIFEGKLSDHAHSIASTGKLMVKNMLAPECVTSYAKLVEDVFDFPSDVLLPGRASELNQSRWQWDLFRSEIEQISSSIENLAGRTSIVYELEEDMMDFIPSRNASQESSEDLDLDVPTTADWHILNEMESSEEVERLEREEIDERMGKDVGIWDEVYRSARKSEKLRFEVNERDEGDLERTGQPICIYEIYSGAGGWPFLHHGSLYRGLSLTSGARRLRSDDVSAVGRLRVLNNTYYRDILCEMGGMFSIANRIDDIHRRPWIGFQSWRAAGRKASLSKKAESVLEKTIKDNSRGDVIYFWSSVDMDGGIVGNNINLLTFWSTCDIMNGGRCRSAFGDAFRKMYGLPSNIEALPPMPEDGGHWSALHSWVMPTPSFLEFIMFSRMFVDSLHGIHVNSSKIPDCSLGFSASEKKHCYCRILEVLVNVWAYHSGRKMVYIDPHSGILIEQHPVEQRKGLMWTKYMNFRILKKMDEELAEAADDNDSLYESWLWPLTGEVYWQGMFEREREERYRLKMEKKRRIKQKMHDRLKHGYKQKTLGGG